MQKSLLETLDDFIIEWFVPSNREFVKQDLLKRLKKNSIPMQLPVKPEIAKFLEFWKKDEEKLIALVGEQKWFTEKVYYPDEVIAFLEKWVRKQFSV